MWRCVGAKSLSRNESGPSPAGKVVQVCEDVKQLSEWHREAKKYDTHGSVEMHRRVTGADEILEDLEVAALDARGTRC